MFFFGFLDSVGFFWSFLLIVRKITLVFLHFILIFKEVLLVPLAQWTGCICQKHAKRILKSSWFFFKRTELFRFCQKYPKKAPEKLPNSGEILILRHLCFELGFYHGPDDSRAMVMWPPCGKVTDWPADHLTEQTRTNMSQPSRRLGTAMNVMKDFLCQTTGVKFKISDLQSNISFGDISVWCL